jgi:hypothetical protein
MPAIGERNDRPSLQFPAGVKPIFVRRTIRTTSRLPESISLERDVFVSKTIGAVSDHVLLMSLLRMPARLLRVLKCAPRKLMPGFVILLFMSFGRDAVSVRGFVVQLGGSLMILVVRSVVVSGGHSEFSYLTGLIMRLFSQRVSMIGILQRSFVMPVAGWIVAFFVVFRSSAMGLRRQFMLFGGFSM